MGKALKKGMRKLLGVMNILVILTVVMVSQGNHVQTSYFTI